MQQTRLNCTQFTQFVCTRSREVVSTDSKSAQYCPVLPNKPTIIPTFFSAGEPFITRDSSHHILSTFCCFSLSLSRGPSSCIRHSCPPKLAMYLLENNTSDRWIMMEFWIPLIMKLRYVVLCHGRGVVALKNHLYCSESNFQFHMM